MLSANKNIVIDPSSDHYFNNKLFDISDGNLNRDGTLLPFYRLRENLKLKEIAINTVDLLLQENIEVERYDYYSLGMLANLPEMEARGDIDFKGFLIMEPPVVAPELYEALPTLTRKFEKVFVHNTTGDGYSLTGVDQTKLRKLYWPQPNFGVMEKYWSRTDRLNRVVVVNGNHKPKSHPGELYSKRINAMVSLADLGVVDLYGRGWERWWSRNSLWAPYWLNRIKLMSIYKGECNSKYEILSKYRFALCFENMEMQGYITEKIFDCFYSGVIPIFRGAPDADVYLPKSTYIDSTQFESIQQMWSVLSAMNDLEFEKIKDAGRAFLNSMEFTKYYNSLEDVILGNN